MSVIEFLHGEVDLLWFDSIESELLGEVLTHQIVGILVGAALPGSVGMGEIDGGIDLAGDGTMCGELPAIVRRQGMDASLERFEQTGRRLADCGGGFVLDFWPGGYSRICVRPGTRWLGGDWRR